jgi:tRNA 2-thiouridine synthesizing protein A
MSVVKVDYKGLKCPIPTMEVAKKALHMKEGDVLEAVADCQTFEKDIRGWCERRQKVLLSVKELSGGAKEVQIQF